MSMYYNQPTAAPTEKVSAGAIAGALSVILVWVAGMFGVKVPAEVAAALTVILSFVAAYMTPTSVPTATDVVEGFKDLKSKE